MCMSRAPPPSSQPHGNARERCHNTTQSAGQTLVLKLPVISVATENDESVLVQYKLSCPKDPRPWIFPAHEQEGGLKSL